MKITIYELLGMVKAGKIPERIKYDDYEYRYHDKEHGYCRGSYDCNYICLDSEYYLFDILNDEVEILDDEDEEKGLPEKIDTSNGISVVGCAYKINEIIDYLEKQKKGNEDEKII